MSCLRNVLTRNSNLITSTSKSSTSSANFNFNRSVLRERTRKTYATTTTTTPTSSDPEFAQGSKLTEADRIPKSETEAAELLKNAKTTEERQRIFKLLIGEVKTPINTKLVTEESSSVGAGADSMTFRAIGRTRVKSDRFGIQIEQSPFDSLLHKLESTSKVLKKLPDGSVYRRSVESLTNHQISIVKRYVSLVETEIKSDDAGKDKLVKEGEGRIEELITKAEGELGVELIEDAIEKAEDEYNLVLKMIEYEAWNDLEEKPLPGQWDFFKVSPSTSYPKD
ncbi:hypothetical protein PPACK8108_LOCUS21706 [Phakopsora pachyrhizi]|uniref:Uncharacterized protein n=1 Tax=Phakopsora pachyrhizi TaxID=170000 RepID=A0AAV0BJ62_PHAPC|nr:hypothetical protein PPACK8108_LOCUS21706 [Phakopsora pachyrhizi]